MKKWLVVCAVLCVLLVIMGIRCLSAVQSALAAPKKPAAATSPKSKQAQKPADEKPAPQKPILAKENKRVEPVAGIDPYDMPVNKAWKQDSDFSCENVNISHIDQTVLKQVLQTMAKFERDITTGINEFENVSTWSMGKGPAGYAYDSPYSGPKGFNIKVVHEQGNETLLIYGPLPSIRYHQCIVPLTESPFLPFCCAVQHLDGNYAIRQYEVLTK